MQRRKLDYRVITDGLEFPEGPIAMADGSVLVVEMKGGKLTRVHPDGTKDVVARTGGGPNGAAIGPDGACYVCQNGGFNWIREDILGFTGYNRPHGRASDYIGGGIQRVDLETGEVSWLYTECDGIPLTGPNDIVFDARGMMWFTEHGKTYGRTMDSGALFHAAPDGSMIRQAAFPMITANGCGLSPDETILYASETETGRLWRWPITGAGELGKAPWPSPNGGELVGQATGYQRFDSMALEACGNVCVATLVTGGITVFTPEGETLEYWEGPEPYCTNIAFGGPDLTTAYITVSGTGLLIAVEWPRAGLALLHQRG
ncbi:gluconolaconase [Novosphingobium sp. PC22D]|uniref:SMP-30/gluconolactonase/LRE family protein n=1 Tax=Novosphingobium sp. PC22D TaxID=1962403 RepID=UPI000BF1B594|nr:SMP-30/gluconolactonase/LRE family protein [Novosphingobium sp. PC22D]PEQ13095.1 gluconolaconase [Novosphingobium sp. PC22D]